MPPPINTRPSSRRWIAVILAAVIATLALILVAQFGRPRVADLANIVRPGAASGFNVILVTLDTVRPDHLGCYGDAAAETPNLDSLLLRHGCRESTAEPSEQRPKTPYSSLIFCSSDRGVLKD